MPVYRSSSTTFATKAPFYKKQKKPSSVNLVLPITTTKQVVIYSDGAAKGNGKSHAKAGYGIFFGEDDPRNIAARVPLDMPQTNQVAELLATTVAMETCVHANEIRKVIVVTDSMYVINGITSWIIGWKKNAWKTSKGGDVLHQSIWQRLDTAQNQLQEVQYIHVRGHQGISGNEAADKLAVHGATL